MQIIKKNARNLTERFIGSSFGQKCVVAAIALIISTSNAMAGSKGAAGFTKATQEVSSYQTPVSNLMKAIAAANYRCFSTSSIILYNYLLAPFFHSIILIYG